MTSDSLHPRIPELPWLRQPIEELSSLRDRGQVPQALLIHGPTGTGRHYLAHWLAHLLLEGTGALNEPLHPDYVSVRPLDGKKVIAIEQIRDLVNFLHLTSHSGGSRVVVCSPAEAMTRQAANSLLKTLEEPPPGAVVILICAAAAAIPATLLSRCQRLRIPQPSKSQALNWLNEQSATADWELLLEFAGGAPVTALALHRENFAPEAQRCVSELGELRRGRTTPLSVARRWASGNLEVLLRWLYREASRSVQHELMARFPEPCAESQNERLQNRPEPLTIRTQFDHLHDIEMLYANRHRTLNMELQLGAVLQRLHGHFRGR